tara:strand:+ start:364 stop:636 length:273 start_codon:yes stop_codon:yes gene_type:complete
MGWKKWNKAPTKKPPEYTWNAEELKIIGFVISKGIKIAMSPDWNHDLHYWQIDIKVRNSMWHTDPKRYSDYEVFESLIKYYKYYYDKYNK